MSLIALFTAPKPFDDAHIATIQTNALMSWSMLPDVEVLLFGEGAGIADAAQRIGGKHIREVGRNRMGTPLISSMLDITRQETKSTLLCVINSDIIVMRDLMEAAMQVAQLRQQFVLLGRRWDMEVRETLDFSNGWEESFRERVQREGEVHRPAGSDFFVFPRECYRVVPEFAVGRAGWDNWMIYQARHEGWPVVDGTPSIMAVHQTHDYRHLPGGIPHYSAPESEENIRLAGGVAHIRYTVLDATLCLRRGKLARPPLSWTRLLRGLELLMRQVFFFLPPNLIEEIARPRRWKKRLLHLADKRVSGVSSRSKE